MNKSKKVWTEKYRPKCPSKLLDQSRAKDFLIGAIANKSMINVILYGQPGTGKTTFSKILIHNFYTYREEDNPEWSKMERLSENVKLYKERVLELNASDERGIKVVRETIKNFAKLSINTSEQNKNIPPYKLIILDEVDNMAPDAQFALRRIIEDYADNTRFILICNYITKIIGPLISRSAKFVFLPVNIENMKKMFSTILMKEGYGLITFSEEIYDYIYTYTKGDMRKSISLLQQISQSTNMKEITIEKIGELIGDVPLNVIHEIVSCIHKKMSGESVKQILNMTKNILKNGYNCLSILDHIHDHYMNAIINDEIKMKIFMKLSEIDNKLNNGCSEYVQLVSLFTYLHTICNGHNIIETNEPFTINLS